MKRLFYAIAVASALVSNVACTQGDKVKQLEQTISAQEVVIADLQQQVESAEDDSQDFVEQLLADLNEENYPEKLGQLRQMYPNLQQEIAAIEAFCDFLVKAQKIADTADVPR